MTDSEIIKALEYCIANDNKCPDCPIFGSEICGKPALFFKEVLNLINRQKAEIVRLKSMNQSKLDAIHDLRAQNEILSKNADAAFQEGLNERRELFEPEIKAEAIKEFTERLKSSIYINTNLLVYQCEEVESVIDDIVKEMVGETK